MNGELTWSSNSSFEYWPKSAIPPNKITRVLSTTNPKAAHPGGVSPTVGGMYH